MFSGAFLGVCRGLACVRLGQRALRGERWRRLCRWEKSRKYLSGSPCTFQNTQSSPTHSFSSGILYLHQRRWRRWLTVMHGFEGTLMKQVPGQRFCASPRKGQAGGQSLFVVPHLGTLSLDFETVLHELRCYKTVFANGTLLCEIQLEVLGSYNTVQTHGS